MMKKTFKNIFLLCLLISLLTFNFQVFADTTSAVMLYVSNDGSDENTGTADKPFATIKRAKEEVRKLSDKVTTDVIVNIKGGNYFLDNTLEFDVNDTLKNGNKVIYKGINRPLISGGRPISGFVPSEKYDNIWQVKAEDFSYIRELYVNGKKSYVANADRTVTGTGLYSDPDSIYETDGMYMSKKDIGFYKNPQDIEMKWAQGWVTATCHVEDIIQDPDNYDQVIVKMQQSWWNIQYVTGGIYGLGPKYNYHFQIENAFELLDRPGEFYFDRYEKILYYMPRADEDMTNAEVIVPYLERLINFQGADSKNKVKNISFEGFKLAHCTWYYPAENSVITYQQQKLNQYTDYFDYVTGAVTLNRTSGIEFKDNYFFGLAASGLDLENDVSDTLVYSNAFSDIGNAAIVSGRGYHGGNDGIVNSSDNIKSNSGYLYNLINGSSKLTSSFYGRDEKNTISNILGTQIWGNADYTVGNAVWRNDPYAVEKSKITWLKYDFLKSYTVSDIVLSFNSSEITSSQKNNFEVLLSDDRNFEKDIYTVTTVKTPVQNVIKLKPQTDKKYRYLMIRTTKPVDFAIAGVWAFTPDVKTDMFAKINCNNTVSNNYIKRADETIYGGACISGGYNDSLTITHNEIDGGTYSGIALGWGWNIANTGSKNNTVSYNYIKNVCEFLGDGAGIYTLSSQPGTFIHDNYVESLFEGNAAFYPDEGSSYEVWDNNVSQDAFYNWHIWTDTIQHNTMTNTYGNHDVVRNNGTNNNFEEVEVFLPGNPPAEAYEVIANAGLEENCEYLKELVYDGDLHMPDERVRFMDMIMANHIGNFVISLSRVAENIISKGNFGSLPWQYPNHYYYKLKTASTAATEAPSHQVIERLIELRSLINEMRASIEHKSLNDMLEFCENTLKNSIIATNQQDISKSVCVKILNAAVSDKRLDTYPSDAAQEFIVAYKNIKNKASETLDKKEQYKLVCELEEHYEKFYYSCQNAGLEYVHVENAEHVEIDDKQKTVKVKFPENLKNYNCAVEIIPFGDSIVARSVSSLNFSKKNVIPVYCKALNKYSYWTIMKDNEHTTDTEEWLVSSDEEEIFTTLFDKTKYIRPTMQPVYYNKYIPAKDNFELKFSKVNPNKVWDMTFIFGANNTGLKTDGVDFNAERFEVKFTSENKGYLYEVYNGEKRLQTVFTLPNLNEENTLSLKMTPYTSKTRIEITLNGTKIINTYSKRVSNGGYFGYYSENTGLIIK